LVFLQSHITYLNLQQTNPGQWNFPEDGLTTAGKMDVTIK